MKNQKKILIKCRNGHWFFGNACPIDGYYDEFVNDVLAAERTIRSRGDDLTLAAIMNESQVSEEAVNARLIIIEASEILAKAELCCLVERTE